jgi:hypothetical protein
MCVCISTTAQRNENADNRANDDCGAAKPKEIIAAFAAFAASRRCGFQSRDSIFLWGQELLRRGSPWSLDYLFLLGVAPRVHRRPRWAHGQWQWSILNADTTCTSLARCGAVQQQRRGAASVASAFGSDAQIWRGGPEGRRRPIGIGKLELELELESELESDAIYFAPCHGSRGRFAWE